MNILVFGGSITWGALDREAGGWVDRMKVHFLTKNSETKVYNLGVSGDKVVDVLERFDAEASVRQPEKILFSVGLNDTPHDQNPSGTPVEEFRKKYGSLLDKAQALTKEVFILELTNVEDIDEHGFKHGYKNEEIEKYNQIIAEVVDQRSLHLIKMFGDLTKADLFLDGLHPDAGGHKKIFEKVLKAIS